MLLDSGLSKLTLLLFYNSIKMLFSESFENLFIKSKIPFYNVIETIRFYICNSKVIIIS